MRHWIQHSSNLEVIGVFYLSCFVGVALVAFGFAVFGLFATMLDALVEKHVAKKKSKERAKWEAANPNWREIEAEAERQRIETKNRAYDAMAHFALTGFVNKRKKSTNDQICGQL